MKRILLVFLTFSMLLLFIGCSNSKTNTTTIPEDDSVVADTSSDKNDETGENEEQKEDEAEEKTEAESEAYRVGDKVEGTLFDFILKDVSQVDVIPNGCEYEVWGDAPHYELQDVTPKEGYKIIRIQFKIDYKGKSAGTYAIGAAMNYDDGFIFVPDVNEVGKRGNPENETGLNFYQNYLFDRVEDWQIVIDDPLSFKPVTKEYYYFVNEEVLTNTDKPLILDVQLPATDSTQGRVTNEHFIYDLR